MISARTLILVTSCLAVLRISAPGQEAAQSTNPPAGAGDAPAQLRDPFWPVGWEPPRLGKVTDATPVRGSLTRWDEAMKLLQVTGLSRGKDQKYLAIIKGIGVVEEGKTVSVNYMGLTYKWKIKAVTSKGIVPEKLGVYPIK